MGAWARSMMVAKTSFGIIGQDKEMLWFPILAGFFSLLYTAALIVPTFVLDLLEDGGMDRMAVGPVQIVVIFVTYFGLSFIATFFNVCVVHTTRVRLSGGDATFLDSIKFAFSRVHLILGWSLVSATVGLFLHMLDSIAERLGIVGKIFLWILRSVLASAWAIMTVFVVPSMVYKGLGPLDAIKDSTATLRTTWGENLVRSLGLGLVAVLGWLACFGLVGGGIALGAPIGFVLIGIGVLGMIVLFVIFGVANTVFNTVLYHFAQTGYAPSGVDPYLLQGAFRVR